MIAYLDVCIYLKERESTCEHIEGDGEAESPAEQGA